MKVPQHPYLSPEAMRLRKRDGIPPWGVHPCEVDSLAELAGEQSAGGMAWREAERVRQEIESQPA
ncbi:hypothetical protein GCM10028862_16730 [Luteimonas pelagia]